MEDRWGEGPPPGADALDRIVHLSRVVGLDDHLVQPGGGNSSLKTRLAGPTGAEEDVLLVKGSGTDLRTIARAGFTRLSLARLAGLRERGELSDEAMVEFMRGCMLWPDDPLPSLETPLHALLPARVVLHTHDVATLSLTNLEDGRAEKLVAELFGGRVLWVPYARPGFPLARSVLELAPRLPETALGLMLAHHGLVVWADDTQQCYARLREAVAEVEEYVAARRRGRSVLGGVRVAAAAPEGRRERAVLLLPVLRGALGSAERVILDFDDGPEVLERIGSERFAELAGRGVATPDHLLWAGRLPVWLDLDLAAGDEELVRAAREGLARGRAAYEAYHERQRAGSEPPLADWAKVLLIPGLGMVTAARDKRGAQTAGRCYRAAMQAIENAEALGGFRFLSEAEVYEFEHWPLERRKLEQAAARERERCRLPRHVAVVVGGASGIGAAAVRLFVEEGASVVVADLDGARAQALADELCVRHPGRAIGAAVDVCDEASLVALFRRSVLEFGGLDSLFYSAGLAPRFASLWEIRREDLLPQLEVHYVGALLALREAARVMRRQGLGGAILFNISKAALAPGREAAAYGGSKAALLQAMRVAALELGEHGIRVNAINADQIDTPLFRRFVAERARSRGRSFDEQIADYRARNALGVSLIPPEAVAELAVMLASDRLRYTTGDILTVDGGLSDAFPR